MQEVLHSCTHIKSENRCPSVLAFIVFATYHLKSDDYAIDSAGRISDPNAINVLKNSIFIFS